GGGMDESVWVDAVRRRLGPAVQMAHDGHKCRHGIGDANNVPSVGAQSIRSYHGGGPAGIQVLGVFLVFDERNAARPGLAERAGGVDYHVAIAAQLSLNQVRQLPEGGTHQGLSSVKETPRISGQPTT